MDAGDLLAWHGEHPERVIRAQIGLGGEGIFSDILQRTEVIGVDPSRVKRGAIMRDIGVGVGQGPAQVFDGMLLVDGLDLV